MIDPTPMQFGIIDILQDDVTFLIVMIGLGAACGAFSRKLSISAFGGFLVYVYVVINTDIFIFDAIMYLVLFIILLWASSYVVSGYFDANSEAGA